MPPIGHDGLFRSIADTITDYRQGEIPSIDAAHVQRWIEQFDPNDQATILTETNSLLQRFYYSRARVKQLLATFIRDELVGRKAPMAALSRVSFLRIQRRGTSQAQMLGMVDEILHEEYGRGLDNGGTAQPDTFVHIDDAIYTGSRLRYDLTPGDEAPSWITATAPARCNLVIYSLATHIDGFNYVQPIIHSQASVKGIRVKYEDSVKILNRRTATSPAECMWPEAMPNDPNVVAYAQAIHTKYAGTSKASRASVFRPVGVPARETTFSSPDARRIIEHAFLRVGVRLATASANPAQSMRPLGYEAVESLGFGTFFVTYRNIANNCPLALWWGDPEYPASHPLGKWYPLFPRRTNVQSSGRMG